MKDLFIAILEMESDKLFYIVVTIIAIYFLLRYFVGRIKGDSNIDKDKIYNIVKKVIPSGEMFIPLYAYEEITSVSYKYYAIGMQEHRMYIVPLFIGETKIGFMGHTLINKDDLSNVNLIKSGKNSFIVQLFNKNDKMIFSLHVNGSNVKMDRYAPFNIQQKEEAGEFAERIEAWVRK